MVDAFVETDLSAVLFLYVETSLHVGTDAGISLIDLPIQRERTTQHPLILGSGIKGVLRSQAKAMHADQAEITLGFGAEREAAGVQFSQGALSFGNAQIVLFPVRSLFDIFAYVTCPLVLARVARNLHSAGIATALGELSALDGQNARSTTVSTISFEGNAVLEEFTFRTTPDSAVDAWASWLAKHAVPTYSGDTGSYWRDKLQSSLIVLSDDAFRDFVIHSTELATQIKLDIDTKTVSNGALWTQESLPPDTLLMSALSVDLKRANGALLTWLQGVCGQRAHFGGDETTGQGVVSMRWQIGNPS